MTAHNKNVFAALFITLDIFGFNFAHAEDQKMMSDAESLAKTINNKSLYSYSISNTTKYDSNPLFLDDRVSILQNIMTGRLGTKTKLDTAEIYFNGSLSVVRSSKSNLIFNQEYPGADLGLIKYLEKDRLEFKLSYQENSARYSELINNGLIFTDNVRVSKEAVFNYAKEINPLTSWDVGITKTYTDYQQRTAILNPFDVFKASTKLKRTLNENLSLVSNFSYNDFNSNSPIKFYTFDVGTNWWVTNNDELNIRLGRSWSPSSASGTGANYSLQFNHLTELGTASFQLTQSTNTSPLGFLLLNKKASLELGRAISSTWNTYALISRTENSNSQTISNNIIFNSLEVGFEKHVNEELRLRIFGGIQQIDRGVKVDSDYVGLSLNFDFER